MQIKIVSKPEELIEILENLYQQKGTYIFRGHPNSNFLLQPSALRKEGLKKLSENFPVQDKELYQWCFSEEAKKIVGIWCHHEKFINDIFVQRIFELNIYILRYNYLLAQYVDQNPEKFDKITLENYRWRPPAWWKEKETFIWFFEQTLSQSLGYVDLAGNVLRKTQINEDLAGYDDYLPQHYGIPTVALDWTYNPFIALFFALKNIAAGVSHLSIYALRLLFESENNPIEIEAGHPDCKNLRIKPQDGTFIRMKYACWYYFVRGKWPSIEDFLHLSLGNFEIIKWEIPVNLYFELKRVVIKKGIDEEYLFPDLKLVKEKIN